MARLLIYVVMMFGRWRMLSGAIVSMAPYIAAAIIFGLLCLLLSKGKQNPPE